MPEGFANYVRTGLTRRHFILSLTASLGFAVAAEANGLHIDDRLTNDDGLGVNYGPRTGVPLQRPPDIFSQVTPEAGIDVGVSFGNSIQKLIKAGALDPKKLRSSSDGLPDWVEGVLTKPSTEAIRFSRDTALYLVDLLWPLGLSTKAAFNKKSPINTLQIPGFASTGGWHLGRARNGYVYFNKIDAITMTVQQEAMVLEAATRMFRPCCDNSTFYQDCNHGSALLGLMELAASQGATAERLYQIALVANSYWFQNEYAETALYFSHFEARSWDRVVPQIILGADYSSLSGWRRNVDDRLSQANVTLPPAPMDSAVCGI